jgi:hypothetical protein
MTEPGRMSNPKIFIFSRVTYHVLRVENTESTTYSGSDCEVGSIDFEEMYIWIGLLIGWPKEDVILLFERERATIVCPGRVSPDLDGCSDPTPNGEAG